MSNTYNDLNLTLFPDSVDFFAQWLDIAAQDGPVIREYMEAMKDGNLALANQILQRIPNGRQKVIKAVDLNKLSQAMLALERFYKSDVKGYIQDKQAEWLNIINQFDYKDAWSGGKTYSKNNLVSYYKFGIDYLYLAIKDVPLGVNPDDEEYWRQITIQGQQGTSGTGLSYRGQWVVSVAYDTNDAVTYDGALWMATAPSQSVTPVQGSSSWRIIMTLSATTYPIQSTEPTNQQAGDLWFNTSENPTRYYYLKALTNPAKAKDLLAGKEAYDSEGNRMVGTGEGVGVVEWNNGVSTLAWN